MEHKGCEADTAHMNIVSCALFGKLLLEEVGRIRKIHAHARHCGVRCCLGEGEGWETPGL